ncbi:MAG TPA: hypothetical protein VK020_10055, partial [Microlunatus sp.]|nr:hypothetical protein [Microlunatus sp.]
MSASHDLDRAAAIGAAVWSVCSVAVAATWLIGLPHAFPYLDSAGLPRLAPGPAALLSWAVIGLSVFSAGAAFSALTPGPGRGPRPATLTGFAAGVLAAGVQVVPLPFDLIAVVATGRLPYPLGLGWKLLTAAALLILAHRLRQEGRRARGR